MTLVKYTVTYDANGGSGAPTDSNTYALGTTVSAIFSPAPTRTGYTFAGWATTNSAVTATYSASGTTSFTITGNTTLYAIWEQRAAAISNIYIEGVTIPGNFDKNVYTYTCSVTEDYDEYNITVTKENELGELEIKLNGNAVQNGSNVSFALGTNMLSIKLSYNGEVKEYTLNITKPASSNANLSYLALSGFDLFPGFNKDVTSYIKIVENSISKTAVEYNLSDKNASAVVKLNGEPVSAGAEFNLNVGDNVVTVEVTAENNTKKTYSATIKRLEPPYVPSGIVSLGLDYLTLSPGFKADVYDYSCVADNSVLATKLSYQTTGSGVIVSIYANGASVAANEEIGLIVGDNNLIAEVSNQDGSIVTYNIRVKREGSNDCYLNSLSLDNASIAFDKTVTGYTASVVNSVQTTRINCTKSNEGASISIVANGTSASLNSDIALNLGLNTIQINVASENQQASMIYTIYLERKALDPGNANLNISSLSINGVSNLNPSFSPDVTNYMSSIANASMLKASDIMVSLQNSNSTYSIKANGIDIFADDNIVLNEGQNNIEITVRDIGSMQEKKYTVNLVKSTADITIYIKDNNAGLNAGSSALASVYVSTSVMLNDNDVNRGLICLYQNISYDNSKYKFNRISYDNILSNLFNIYQENDASGNLKVLSEDTSAEYANDITNSMDTDNDNKIHLYDIYFDVISNVDNSTKPFSIDPNKGDGVYIIKDGTKLQFVTSTIH